MLTRAYDIVSTEGHLLRVRDIPISVVYRACEAFTHTHTYRPAERHTIWLENRGCLLVSRDISCGGHLVLYIANPIVLRVPATVDVTLFSDPLSTVKIALVK